MAENNIFRLLAGQITWKNLNPSLYSCRADSGRDSMPKTISRISHMYQEAAKRSIK
jgi:hypothetical protein